MLILAPLVSIPCLRYTAFRFFLPLSCFYPLPYLTLYFAILLNFIVRILCSLSGWILCSLSINTKILLFDILILLRFIVVFLFLECAQLKIKEIVVAVYYLGKVGIYLSRLLQQRLISFFNESNFRIPVFLQKCVYFFRRFSRYTRSPYLVLGFSLVFMLFFVSFISFASRFHFLTLRKYIIVSIRRLYFTVFCAQSQAFLCKQRVKAALNFQFRRYSFPCTSAIILFSRYILKSWFPTCSEHLCPNSLDKAYPAFAAVPLSKLFSCQFRVIIVRRFFNLCLDSSFCAPYFVCFSVIPLSATAGKLLSTIIGKLRAVCWGVSRKFYKKIAEKFSRQPHIKRKSDITQTSFFDYYICLQFFFTDKIRASCLSYYLSSLKLL